MEDRMKQEQTDIATAVSYLSWVLEEGSLVPRYDEVTRREIAVVLTNLLEKVSNLPDGTPEHLVQATAVRAIIQAQEQSGQEQRTGDPESNRRKAELAFGVQGHLLGEWHTDDGQEYEAVCAHCQGVVYANAGGFYGFRLRDCPHKNKSNTTPLDEDTLLVLWDMDYAS